MQTRTRLLVSSFLLLLVFIPGASDGSALHAVQDAGPAQDAAPREAPEAAQESRQSGAKQQDAGLTRAERLLAKQREVEKAARELGYAKIEITLAEMKAESDLAAVEHTVQDGERELARAEEALAGFAIAFEAGRAEAQLKVARAENSLNVARADLTGILDIYAEEQEARAKKEIIRRHEAAVRFAERAVEIAGLEAKKKIDHELPRERETLRWGVEKAKAGLVKARAALARTQLAGELELTRARDAELAAKHKLSDLKRVHKRLRAAASKKKKASGPEKAPKNDR